MLKQGWMEVVVRLYEYDVHVLVSPLTLLYFRELNS